MTTAENKIPNVSSLVKTKKHYDTKILDIENKVTNHDHDEYITTSEFNNLTRENFKARLAQENVITKTDFDAKLRSPNKKLNPNKKKHLLIENVLKKLQAFDLSYFGGKNYFEEDGTLNY